MGIRGSSALVERSPETWLADVRKLKAQGRTEEAERELAEFRKRYPDFRLPDDLR
jgi:TolA-binding protein